MSDLKKVEEWNDKINFQKELQAENADDGKNEWLQKGIQDKIKEFSQKLALQDNLPYQQKITINIDLTDLYPKKDLNNILDRDASEVEVREDLAHSRAHE